MIFKDNLLFPEKTIVNVISAPAQIKFTHLKCVQRKQNYFTIDWICSFSSGTKTLHFSDDHIMMSSHPFQFLRPATLESFSALLFLSQKSSSMFSQFCWLLIQQWLLLLCRSLCWLFHSLLVGFRLQFWILIIYSHSTEWSQWNLSWVMPCLCLETSNYSCNLAPLKANIIRMACEILHLLTLPLSLLLPPLSTQPWPPCSSTWLKCYCISEHLANHHCH